MVNVSKFQTCFPVAGLENSTRPLVFTSASGCRASEKFDISSEINFFPMYANIFCDAGQVPILRYFEACIGITHLFSCINICQVLRKLFEHKANRPRVQTFPEGPGKC